MMIKAYNCDVESLVLNSFFLVCVVLTLLVSSTGYAGEQILVLDAEGQPVRGAVISVPGKPSESPVLSSASLKTMDQVDLQFKPEVLLVRAGDRVDFPNSDAIRHHVYSFSKPNQFEIKLYSGESADPVIFDHPGIVVLGCNIHDQMRGFIYVAGEEYAAITDDTGLVNMDVEPGQSLTVWHHRLSSSVLDTQNVPLSQRNDQGDWVIRLELVAPPVKKKKTFRDRYR